MTSSSSRLEPRWPGMLALLAVGGLVVPSKLFGGRELLAAERTGVPGLVRLAFGPLLGVHFHVLLELDRVR